MSEEIAWEPPDERVESSNVTRFMDEFGYEEYDELVPGTEAELARIWGDFAEDTGIVWREPYNEVVDTSEGVEFAEWYTGGRLNAVETILDQWADRTPEGTMYRWVGETGNEEAVSHREMRRRSDRLANAFRAHGVERGDVVGVVFPMHPNGFATCLACLRVGAAFTMIFPGYGAEAIAHRLDDAGAELLVAADGYRRGGDVTDLRARVDSAVEHAPSVSDVLLYEHVGVGGAIEGATVHEWETFLEGHDADAETAVMDSDDTAFLAYSSGTTGTPKGTIHTHASLVAMGNKEARYQFDVSEDDTLMWVTDFGWVIVPIWMLAGAPALGAETVLMEGGPAHPSEDRIWRLIDEFGVTVFGISPSGARGRRQHDETPRDSHDLSSLRVLGSTGEPWDEDGWRWFLEAVGGGEAPIINASGGTELAGAILAPTPVVPLKPATLYGPAPGVAADIYDDDGNSVDEGYLVVELPIPGMTHGLTGGRERYLAEYWSDFDGVWNQNDWAERDEDGFWFITGRADDTMNIAGRRITAPTIEGVIAEHSDVGEVAVVAVPDETKGQVPVAFVTLAEGADPSEERLEEALFEQVADELGAPFRPAAVHVVPALPRTQTGKVPRSVLESTYLGEPTGDTATLENGEALADYPRADER